MAAMAELGTRSAVEGALSRADGAPMFELIELLFFAYRDFAADADQLLLAYGFGRAHHRALHFVERRPGLTVAELLEILRVTKQSLGRVLKELVEGGFVEAQPGTADRRQRRLFATPNGQDLALRLAQLQSRRLKRALAELPFENRPHARAFLAAMVDQQDRSKMAANASAGAGKGRLGAMG